MNIEGRPIEDVLDDEADHSTGERDRAVLMRLAAATIRKYRAAGFVTPEGEVRKVLGTLPLTADGCVVGNHSTVWVNDAGELVSLRVDNIGCTDRVGCDEGFFEAHECYSTREAAEAARKAGEGGQ